MAKKSSKPKYSTYYGFFPVDIEGDKNGKYVLVAATSIRRAIAELEKQYPECETVIPEKDVDAETVPPELEYAYIHCEEWVDANGLAW